MMMLTQIGEPWTKNGRLFAQYRCDCGSVVIRRTSNVNSGATKSCGCLDRKRRVKHGGADTPTYNSWKSMISRCCRKAHPSYGDYGGRGITVCERWKDFAAFLADMGQRPAGTSIDRFPDNDGNYEPGNCRWATRRQQRLNTRNSLALTVNGRTMTAFEWSQETGAVNYDCIIGRHKRGWPDDKAVFLPMQSAGGVGNKWSNTEIPNEV